MSRRVAVVNVVGLTPKLLDYMPRTSGVARGGTRAAVRPVLPAVTCSMQATFMTGQSPSEHGIVGNGWFFKELGEVLLWRQSNALVQGEKLWETARRRNPSFKTANICWWYAQGASTDVLITPKPVYHADGRKDPDCYAIPTGLRDELTDLLGPFPLFQYWGPTAGIASSQWIGRAAVRVFETHAPDLTLVYIPHLDYDLQRFGPDSPKAIEAARAVDDVVGEMVDVFRREGAEVVIVSEYGITAVSRPVHINRVLRRAGLLRTSEQAGMEYLDTFTSDAFAVSDHQLAHVYVKDPARIDEVAKIVADIPGVAEVLSESDKSSAGLAHDRAGDLVAVADRDSWFTYYYWLRDDRAPDFAHIVDIHRKPGYDPVELFFNPHDRYVKARAGLALAKKKAGMRYLMNVVSLDATVVRGSHGRLPASVDEGPVLLSSLDLATGDHVEATEVRDLLLKALDV